MEHVRVLADDLRSVNEHRRMQSDVSRARLFKAHCLCRLREIVESSAIHCGDFLEVLHRAERALIADASCGSTLTHQIDQALERFCTDLRRLEEEALERDRRRMADLPFQNIVGAKASPHRKLITVRIRTFSGAEFQVRCGLDENLLCLKEYIHASGGPRARDQQLVWSRSELAWIQSLETRASDSFSLFYLGITDGDSATLYYVRFCHQCRGACRCVECHGRGSRSACSACGQVRPSCLQCAGPCVCPNCHGQASLCGGMCQVCGESSVACDS